MFEDPAIHGLVCRSSMSYFWDNVIRVARNDYVPNDLDIVMFRNRTSGRIEQKFEINGYPFSIVDVGGTKTERKKWSNHFKYEKSDAVMFMASLTAYNQNMWQDSKKNQMIDSLEVFETLCSNESLEQNAFFLVLTKTDVFSKQIHKYPLSECFP